MKEKFLIHSNYYHRPWTWFKRSFEFLIAIGFFWAYVVGIEGEYAWLKYTLFAVLSVYIFARPVDELAVSKTTLFYIRKSAIGYFTRVEAYHISQIESIGCGGLYDTDTELWGRVRATSNRLEIIFKDNSSKALDVKIYKNELKWIVKNVLKLMHQDRAQ